jgi:serine/threonine protein kinase
VGQLPADDLTKARFIITHDDNGARMTLASGTRLGQYEILSSLGAGGLGEVYRAPDTRLGREVALNFFPQTMAHDAERLARFRREAKSLAQLDLLRTSCSA